MHEISVKTAWQATGKPVYPSLSPFKNGMGEALRALAVAVGTGEFSRKFQFCGLNAKYFLKNRPQNRNFGEKIRQYYSHLKKSALTFDDQKK